MSPQVFVKWCMYSSDLNSQWRGEVESGLPGMYGIMNAPVSSRR